MIGYRFLHLHFAALWPRNVNVKTGTRPLWMAPMGMASSLDRFNQGPVFTFTFRGAAPAECKCKDRPLSCGGDASRVWTTCTVASASATAAAAEAKAKGRSHHFQPTGRAAMPNSPATA